MGQKSEQTTGVVQQFRITMGSSETFDAPVGVFVPWRAVVCGRGSAAINVAPVRDAAEVVEFV